MNAVYEKCNQKLRQGLRAYLLITDSMLEGARQWTKQLCQDLVAVESLETFVYQNIEEMGLFSNGRLRSEILKLITLYNNRVDEVEIDKSLMIDLPENLNSKND